MDKGPSSSCVPPTDKKTVVAQPMSNIDCLLCRKGFSMEQFLIDALRQLLDQISRTENQETQSRAEPPTSTNYWLCRSGTIGEQFLIDGIRQVMTEISTSTDNADGNTAVENVDNEYEVEDIIDHKILRGRISYLIRWKNYDSGEDTWEPESALPKIPKILSQYKERAIKDDLLF